MALVHSEHDRYFHFNVTSRVPTSPPPLTDEGFLAIGIYLTFLGVVAFVGNIVVLFIILSQRTGLRKLQNILLVNMSLADLIVTLTSYPMTALSSFTRDHWLSTEMVRPAVVMTWVHSVVWTALPLLGWNRYVPEAFGTSCTIDWDSGLLGHYSYTVMTIATCYVLPLSVILFCYGSILCKSRKLTFGTRKDSSLVKLEEVLWHHKISTEREVTKMCAVMVGAFFMCWTPYATMSVVAMCGVHLSTQMTVLPTMFAKLSCAINPIIYAFMSSKFREGISLFSPWVQRNQNRVSTAAIEMSGQPKMNHREPVTVREYRGDMTNQGVYIGNMAVTLEVQSTVF